MLQRRNTLSSHYPLMPGKSLFEKSYANTSIFATPLNSGILSSTIINTKGAFDSINSSINTINTYNLQYQSLMNNLNLNRNDAERKLSELLLNNHSDDSMRNTGVKLMWGYHKAEAQMGGNSANFTPEQYQELLEKGKVLGYEGHHINSVHGQPSLQANPDNVIPLAEDRFGGPNHDHWKAHDYNWNKPTEGTLIDRNKILTDTNEHRISEKQIEIRDKQQNIIKNELVGITAAIAVGFGFGFTIGFIVTLAQNGINAESFRTASLAGFKTGATSAVISGISYVVTRTIGEVVSSVILETMKNHGVKITNNIAKICTMATMGIISIAIYSTYQFIVLKRLGHNTNYSAKQIMKQSSFSIATMLLFIIAKAKLSKNAGIVIMAGTTLIFVFYNVAQQIISIKTLEKIQLYAIEKYYPIY